MVKLDAGLRDRTESEIEVEVEVEIEAGIAIGARSSAGEIYTDVLPLP